MYKAAREIEDYLAAKPDIHVDSYGLPSQSDGDVNDQLQRTAMLAMGYALSPMYRPIAWATLDSAIRKNLQPRPGVYARFTGADTANCSADQIISALCYWVTVKAKTQILLILGRMILRLGFSQNYRDGLGGEHKKIKLPDFMLIRALPLVLRISPLLYPLIIVADLLLVLSSLASVMPVWEDDKGFRKKSPTDVDDNLNVMTLVACKYIYPTPISCLAVKLYAKLRPWNVGCIVGENQFALHPIIAALTNYHRSSSGGNPVISKIWAPIINKFFL